MSHFDVCNVCRADVGAGQAHRHDCGLLSDAPIGGKGAESLEERVAQLERRALDIVSSIEKLTDTVNALANRPRSRPPRYR